MLSQNELISGTELLQAHLVQLQESNPEFDDFHTAFEHYCMERYSLGSRSETVRIGGKNDRGVDCYSSSDARYNVIQTKIPTPQWLDANPKKVKKWPRGTVNDPEDAFEHFFEGSKKKANPQVQHLFGLIQTDMGQADFSFTYFLVIYGYLDKRAKEAFEALKDRYKQRGYNLILQNIEHILNDFLVGKDHSSEKITFNLQVNQGNRLSQHNYHYFLTPAADLYKAFLSYGWRLFELNVRYEIRNSPVNGDIVSSLSTIVGRKSFHHFNNGLIIVVDNAQFKDHGKTVKLSNAQIVNGLQTVKSIYNAVSTQVVTIGELKDGCLVQVKVIDKNDPQFVSDVVQSTNNQNPMSIRNLRSNNREQKKIQRAFADLKPRWFYQRKQGEWDSLTGEGGRYFKRIIGYPQSDFKPVPSRKKGRVIDNQDLAKAWLAFLGFPDKAADRTAHYFSNDNIYRIAFLSTAGEKHWQKIQKSLNLGKSSVPLLIDETASRYQYLLAFGLWCFIRGFLPSPKVYRVEALEEGHKDGIIRKANGSYTSAISDQDAYLATNSNYQTWRLMSNMKEVLLAVVSHILVRRYGQLTNETCKQILHSFDLKEFELSGDAVSISTEARNSLDLASHLVFGRTMHFLKFAVQQFFEDKSQSILATSRIRTYLIRPTVIKDFMKMVDSCNLRTGVDRGWKAGGITFIESLPDLSDQAHFDLD